jgi:hypothetical protein
MKENYTPGSIRTGRFAVLARAFYRARALHPFYLTAWVFLPDHWHCIGAPVYPVTISLATKPVKPCSADRRFCGPRLFSMSAVNQRRGAVVASSRVSAL